MNHAYTSFNKALKSVWVQLVGGTTDAPAVDFIIRRPRGGQPLPNECLVVQWLNHGEETTQSNELEAVIQMDLYVPEGYVARVLERARSIASALGFHEQAGYGRMWRSDFTVSPAQILSEMQIYPGSGWENVDEAGVERLTRRIILTYTTTTDFTIAASRSAHLLLEDGSNLLL